MVGWSYRYVVGMGRVKMGLRGATDTTIWSEWLIAWKKWKACTYPPAENLTVSVPAAYRPCSPSIEKAPLSILSPKATPNGIKRSFRAGIFVPPVTGVHQKKNTTLAGIKASKKWT